MAKTIHFDVTIRNAKPTNKVANKIDPSDDRKNEKMEQAQKKRK